MKKAQVPVRGRRNKRDKKFLARKRILHLDCDPEYLRLIKGEFREAGAEVVTVSSALEAQARILHGRPFDLIVYGMMMPVTGEDIDVEAAQDGLAMGKEFERWFRRQHPQSAVPMLLLTSRYIPRIRKQGLLPEGRHDRCHEKTDVLPCEVPEIVASMLGIQVPNFPWQPTVLRPLYLARSMPSRMLFGHVHRELVPPTYL